MYLLLSAESNTLKNSLPTLFQSLNLPTPSLGLNSSVPPLECWIQNHPARDSGLTAAGRRLSTFLGLVFLHRQRLACCRHSSRRFFVALVYRLTREMLPTVVSIVFVFAKRKERLEKWVEQVTGHKWRLTRFEVVPEWWFVDPP